MQNVRFRDACGKYGVSWENFEVYDEVIILNTPKENLYILMDKNYNTISVDRLDYVYPNVKKEYYRYTNFTDVLGNRNKFGYPCEDFTLKQIIDLANRVEVMETNHGHSLRTQVNGVCYDRETAKNEDYFKLLSYIKFLGEEIKQYFLLCYHMQAWDLKYLMFMNMLDN